MTLNIEAKQQKNWQKLCAAEDFYHPEFQDVLNQVFNRSASFHRKQWEFVTIYLNLLQNNKIKKNMTGASFGAGREPLIYLIGSRVKSFTATDLYIYDTGWQTAKINKQQSCRDFVMEKAPMGIDGSAIDVKEMDMRVLDFPDNSLDFCYSSCAFEHIGHEADFLAHLSEVKRVLKADGIYVMTTEYLFNHSTFKVQGNYKFDAEYLWQLFEKSGLYPDAEFDATMHQSLINKPKLDLSPIAGMTQPLMVSIHAPTLEKQGVPYTSCCFVLRKSNQKNIGLEQLSHADTQQFMAKASTAHVRKIYSQYQYLNPISGLKKSARSALADHLEFITADADQHFEQLEIDGNNFIHTDFVYYAEHTCHFVLDISCRQEAKINVTLVEKPQLIMQGRKNVMKQTMACQAGHSQLTLSHACQADKVYALTVSSKQDISHFDLKSTSIRVKVN